MLSHFVSSFHLEALPPLMMFVISLIMPVALGEATSAIFNLATPLQPLLNHSLNDVDLAVTTPWPPAPFEWARIPLRVKPDLPIGLKVPSYDHPPLTSGEYRDVWELSAMLANKLLRDFRAHRPAPRQDTYSFTCGSDEQHSGHLMPENVALAFINTETQQGTPYTSLEQMAFSMARLHMVLSYHRMAYCADIHPVIGELDYKAIRILRRSKVEGRVIQIACGTRRPSDVTGTA